jgi:WD40 repeat protein
MNCCAVLALVLLLGPALLRAGELGTDRTGDPLPEGAVARFGSGRLLHGLVGHLEFSPDGKTLATSGGDGARLWDVAIGKEIVLPHLPRTGHVVLTFTPDGAHVVGDVRGGRVIDPATGKVRCSWREVGKRPQAIIVAADGRSAVTAWEDGGVTVHDLGGEGRRSGRTLSDDDTDQLTLSADGSMLAYFKDTRKEKSILLWDVRQGKLLHAYAPVPKEPPGCRSLCLSPDGRRLAASWDDRFLRLWDTTSHEEVKGFVRPEVEVGLLRFSPDGTELIGVSQFHRTRYRWSPATGKELACSSDSAPGEGGWYWRSALSADGRTIAGIRHARGGIKLWEAAAWKELHPVERGPECRGVAFVGPGVVATYTRGGKQEVIAFWDVTDGRLLRRHTITVPEDEWWHRALSPDGKLFAASNEKAGVLLLDVESDKEVRRLDPPRREDRGVRFAFSLDGQALVTTDYPDGLMLWDVATGEPLRKLAGDSSGVLAFSPDGRTVASAFVRHFSLTEVASGKARHRLPLPDSEERDRSEAVVDRITFARNGRSVAVFSEDAIRVFSTDRGRTILHLHQGPRGQLWEHTGALSPDGRWLVHAGGSYGEVYVRDLHSRFAVSECQTLFGHAGGIEALEFAPDGKYLVTCGQDGTALVWDVQRFTGKPEPAVPESLELALEEAEARWHLLGDADPGRAARAMAELADSPDVAVALLRDRLKPVQGPPAGQVERLVADLDSDRYAVREKARQELRQFGEQAVPALRQALEGRPSAEVARQAKELLTELTGPVTDPERLRQVRAVEVLERLGTPAARAVLEALAKGGPDARLTQEARASLARWPAP